MADQERVAYFNGKWVPEAEVMFHYKDSIIMGDSVFDTSRTYSGELFKIDSHVDRLFRSAQYTGIEPGLSKDEFKEIMKETVKRNLPLLAKGDDWWVNSRVSRGVRTEEGQKASVLVECHPLPWDRAKYYTGKEGVVIMTAGSVRRTPPWALSPQAKISNYMNERLADMEVKAKNPDAWALMLNEEGNVAEGTGWNFFIVKDGAVYAPEARWGLFGISRETVLELARGLGIPTYEKDFGIFEVYTADEAMVTGTSTCMLPVETVNGNKLGDQLPGPITTRLLQALSDRVGLDVVEQYLRHLND